MEKEKLGDLLSLNELALTEEEIKKTLENFSFMNEKENKVNELPLENKQVAVFVLPIMNVLREDVTKQDFPREDLLKGAPQATEDSWQVPRLVK